jgi:VanZ family protein
MPSPRLARWALAAWLVLIFIASSIPAASMPSSEIFRFDKLIHFGVFAVLGSLGARAAGKGRRGSGWLVGWAIAAVWGCCDEFHQSFVPGRAVELLDVVADVTGGLLGALVVWRLTRPTTKA